MIRTIGELKKELNKFKDDEKIYASGCYGSEGSLYGIYRDCSDNELYIETDIMTG